MTIKENSKPQIASRKIRALRWASKLRRADHCTRVLFPIVYVPVVLSFLGAVSFGGEWAETLKKANCGEAQPHLYYFS